MSLIFGNNDCFFHIPRCGGNYTRRVISRLQKDGKRTFAKNHTPGHGGPLVQSHLPIARSFCIVRDPLSWYKSFYRYTLNKHYDKQRLKPGHVLHHFIWQDQNGPVKSFDEFLSTINYRFRHGYVTSLYCSFIPFVTNILFTEQLTSALPELLASWGYDVPIKLPRIPTNATTALVKRYPADASKETINDMIRNEIGIIRYLESIRNGYERKISNEHISGRAAVAG
jgi:hypothetical protein